jgi:uncharacterized membrane protein YeaQ/YmgE (transglycosylase-associated protein family)
MKVDLTQIGIETTILIGAVAGAILALKKSKEKWYHKLTTMITGIIGSVYLSPLACSMLGITEDKLKTAIAVLIGYGGLSFVDKILAIITKKLEDGNNK